MTKDRGTGEYTWKLPTQHGQVPTRVEVRPLGWQTRGLSYTATGYGYIPTRYRVRFAGGPWRRVWAVCHSNAASFYVRHKRERLIIPTQVLDALIAGVVR